MTQRGLRILLFATCVGTLAACGDRDGVEASTPTESVVGVRNRVANELDPIGSTNPFCTLGSSACGSSNSYINADWDEAHGDANTFTQGNKYAALGTFGVLTVVSGFNTFPQVTDLLCTTIRGQTCAVSATLATDCASYKYTAKVGTFHTAVFLNGAYLDGSTSDVDTCEPYSGGGGGGGGGGSPTCYTYPVTVEILNEQTGLWDYFSTSYVEVCG